jgi:hypothetical protein
MAQDIEQYRKFINGPMPKTTGESEEEKEEKKKYVGVLETLDY